MFYFTCNHGLKMRNSASLLGAIHMNSLMCQNIRGMRQIQLDWTHLSSAHYRFFARYRFRYIRYSRLTPSQTHRSPPLIVQSRLWLCVIVLIKEPLFICSNVLFWSFRYILLALLVTTCRLKSTKQHYDSIICISCKISFPLLHFPVLHFLVQHFQRSRPEDLKG